MIINPWIYYMLNEPDKIPDLTPHNDEQTRGCLAGICAYILASSIFIWLMYLILDFKLNEKLNTDVYLLLILVICAIIYPILTIVLMNLAFKIVDKCDKKEIQK